MKFFVRFAICCLCQFLRYCWRQYITGTTSLLTQKQVCSYWSVFAFVIISNFNKTTIKSRNIVFLTLESSAWPFVSYFIVIRIDRNKFIHTCFSYFDIYTIIWRWSIIDFMFVQMNIYAKPVIKKRRAHCITTSPLYIWVMIIEVWFSKGKSRFAYFTLIILL